MSEIPVQDIVMTTRSSNEVQTERKMVKKPEDEIEIEKSNILIVGETGTGKELFAEAIRAGLRPDTGGIRLSAKI